MEDNERKKWEVDSQTLVGNMNVMVNTLTNAVGKDSIIFELSPYKECLLISLSKGPISQKYGLGYSENIAGFLYLTTIYEIIKDFKENVLDCGVSKSHHKFDNFFKE